MDWSSGFGLGTGGVFDSVGGSLASNPFGGASGLNVGGFSGAAPGYGGAFGGMGGAMSLLGGANAFMGGLQQANLNRSAQNQFAAQNAMFDASFGQDMFAQNFDRFRSFRDPVVAAQIAVNDPNYRQRRSMENLPNLAGKYGSFGAFVS